MKSLKNYDKYIKGELSEKELDDFTKEIIRQEFEDEDLKKKWNGILDKDQELQAMKSEENNAQTESKTMKINEAKRKPKNLGFILSIAATLLFLVAIAFYFSRPTPPSLTQLADNELAKPYSVSSSRTGVTADDDNRLLAEDFYRQGDYNSAIPLYKQLIRLPNVNGSDLFYLGLSQLYLGQQDQAIPNLLAAQSAKDNAPTVEAGWYLAIAFIKSNQPYLAKIELQKLVDKGGWKSKEAAEFISSINNLAK